MKTQRMHEAARDAFASKGLTYRDITTGDILALIMMLNVALKAHNKAVTSEIALRLSEKVDIKQNRDGTIRECYLYANGSYFTRREAISFNSDGFIGFCGWADPCNTRPFAETFVAWLDTLNPTATEMEGEGIE